ncbi:MAG: hypothetical protein ACHQX1_01165 [Candidatus Micrarchaeales archaeon]
MSGFSSMAFFYGSLALVPLMLWVIAISPLLPFSYLQLHLLRFVLAILVGIGSIIFSVIGFNEVFGNGR